MKLPLSDIGPSRNLQGLHAIREFPAFQSAFNTWRIFSTTEIGALCEAAGSQQGPRLRLAGTH